MKSKTVDEQVLQPADESLDESLESDRADHVSDEPAASSSGSAPERLLKWPIAESPLPGIETKSEQALRFFFTTGIRPGDTTSVPQLPLHPAVLHPYLGASTYRSPWPLVLSEKTIRDGARALPNLIDQAIENLTGEGDAFEIGKRALYQLEKGLRDLCSEGKPVDLATTVEDVQRVLLKTVNGKKDRFEIYRTAMASFGHLLDGTERLLPFGIESAVALVKTTSLKTLRSAIVSFREEVDWLSGRLADILLVEAEDSTEGVAPERLEHTVGGSFLSEFDFGSLSHLLEAAPHGPALSETRKKRIIGIRSDLDSMINLLYDNLEESSASDVKTATALVNERNAGFTRLIRAVHMARLEVENRYRPERHDRIFDVFSPNAIEPGLLELRPPIFLHLTSTDAAHHASEFSSLLDQDWPVRCVVTVERALNDAGQLSGDALVGFTTLARTDRYVAQSSLASASELISMATDASQSSESSLVVVYVGSEETHPDLPGYLRAAISTDTRVFPSFRYRPAPDSEWIDRFSAEGNEQSESIWPVESLAVAGSADPETISITAADFIAVDRRFRDSFLPVSPDTTLDALLPLEGYLELTESEKSGHLPYILLADGDGQLIRAVVSQQITRTVTTIRDRWRQIQEWSGINSSIAQRETQALRTALEQEHASDLEAARLSFEQQLNESTEAVARQIVENIAANLLGSLQLGAGSLMQPPAQRPIRPAVAPTPAETTEIESSADAAKTAEVEEEESDDLPLSFDDPYIDTPLCTTCNECTDLNGLMFGYNENKQAEIKDPTAGTFRELVLAAEKCPVRIIHPGKPKDPKEPNLEEWVERARPFQ